MLRFRPSGPCPFLLQPHPCALCLVSPQIIRTSTSLKKLGLSFNKIGKEGCRALTSAISANQSLKQLQILPGNPVEEKDAKALAKALKRNTKFSIRTFLGIGA